MKIDSFFIGLWYQRQRRLAWLLLPIALLYTCGAALRRLYLTRIKQWQAPVPVVIVGNITLGGVGKTPLVVKLAKHCQQQGWCVGVVSRGYRARCSSFPYEVLPSDMASHVGDESLYLARALTCPVVIAPNRVEAVKYLLAHHAVDLIISDDGLQHYALGRQIEVAVIDGCRGVGNGLRFPAGPLREARSRLQTVDFRIVNAGEWQGAFQMSCHPTRLRCIKTGQAVAMATLQHQPFSAVAGIGSPGRFFSTLHALGCQFNAYAFPDHYDFSEQDFNAMSGAVVMTEKDAVKCETFAKEDWYSLDIEASVAEDFWRQFDELVSLKRKKT